MCRLTQRELHHRTLLSDVKGELECGRKWARQSPLDRLCVVVVIVLVGENGSAGHGLGETCRRACCSSNCSGWVLRNYYALLAITTSPSYSMPMRPRCSLPCNVGRATMSSSRMVATTARPVSAANSSPSAGPTRRRAGTARRSAPHGMPQGGPGKAVARRPNPVQKSRRFSKRLKARSQMGTLDAGAMVQ